jgi:ankyrin repeat protein
MTDSFAELAAAVQAGRVAEVRSLLASGAALRARLNEPRPELAFDSTLLLIAVYQKNRQLIDVLLDAGADINARSGWWAGGFGVLDGCDPELVPFLIERGAAVNASAAARLGQLDTLRELLDANPEAVHSRGGDGQTPLHVASSVEAAALLLDRGADMDALDVDHESTPAQYMVRDRQEIARFLVARGARADILLAAALGDAALVQWHLDRDPDSLRTSVSDEHFPKRDPRAGGSIYIWTLGAHKTPHAVAREFGHGDVVQLLLERSPGPLRLVAACEAGDEHEMRALLAAHPGVASELSAAERARLPIAARDNNARAVRLMLDAGWPVDVKGPESAAALHWAAFHGNALMVRALLGGGPDVHVEDGEHGGTPLGWAIYGSRHGWHCRTGDYAAVVKALLEAGAAPPSDIDALDASDAVRAALRA